MSVHDLRTSPSRLVVRHQEQQLLLAALRRIPIDLQILLELHYWERLSSRELGEVLEIPPPTVRSRLRRARQMLSERIADTAPDAELRQSVLTSLDKWASSLRKVIETGPEGPGEEPS